MLEIYLRMNTLLYGNSLSTFLGKNESTSILKSSGTRTPAPTSKVLRWKDLEAAALEVAQASEELEMVSGQSEFGTEEARPESLQGEIFRDDNEHYVEELFV
jgi:hypothetical protein